MAVHERGVYQPPAEDGPMYDIEEEEEEERSRLPLLIVVALLVVGAFAGVVWLAYNQGVEQGRAGAPPVIAAMSGPAKTVPDNPNESPVPYTGLKVYNEPVPPDEEASSSALASQPDTSIPETPAPQVAAAQPPAMRPAEAPAAAAPAKPAPQVAATPAPAPAPVAAAPAASGSVLLQIGAYPTQADAQKAWSTFQKKYSVASAYSSNIQSADLGAKGTWYRLRMGPFADKAAATSTCDQIKAEGGGCFLAAP